jgi:hypothetical protein
VPDQSDISLRGIAVGAAIILGGIAFSLGAARLFVRPVEVTAPQRPLLRTAPREDLAAFMREKNARLHSRGPIEGDPRHVHIPIEEAMRRLSKQ